MRERAIVYQPVVDLVPRDTNPRTHSDKQIDQIAQSIRHFGFTNPVLVDQRNGVVAGHGRLLAARRLGMEAVPTINLGDMSEADIRAYVIADNRIAETAGWDRRLLALEFRYLSELELDFDLTLTGFEPPEIDIALGEITFGADAQEPDPADAVSEPDTGARVTRPGDVWWLGRHRLICADATELATYEQLLGAARAQMAFCDPPYNVPIDGHVCGSGAVRHREFAMASGELSAAAFTQLLTTVFRHLAHFSKPGSIHFHCMDWRHQREILDAGAAAYSELKNLCVWTKTNAGMGSLYRSQHEMIYVFKAGKAAHINNVELGRHGRHRSNVWTYPGVNGFGGGQADLALHPTVKPVAMVRDAILDCSRRAGLVLDAFAGSGTTLVAAEQTGRRGYGVELDPAYCDVAVRRLKATCGLEARLGRDGPTYDAVAAVRNAAAQSECASAPSETAAA